MGKSGRIPCGRQDSAKVAQAAKHVDHECEQFEKTQREMRSWGGDFASSEEDAARRAAVYVAWLVHLRCLTSFFRPQQDYGDEVLACHFMDNPAKWAADHEAVLELSATERERVGRIDHLVAHITYERLVVASDFDTTDHEMVVKRLRIFYDALPAQHRPCFPALAALVT